MPKLDPPPPVDPSTWQALLSLAVAFEELAPWEFVADTEWVGLEDVDGRDYRLASVLGNAREVFGPVFYRRAGIAWLLKVLDDDFDPRNVDAAEGMDCLKLEFVMKRELGKEDVALLKSLGFKPARRGCSWPQFRSAMPGWHPWHINQAEAEQLLADLPRLIGFCRLFAQNPSLFQDRPAAQVPFLPARLPDRPLTLNDVDWRPCLRLPEPPLSAYTPSADEIGQLQRMKPTPGLAFEFDSALMPGASFYQDGRPCFGRMTLLVESATGIVLSAEVKPGSIPAGAATGAAFASALCKCTRLPSKLILRKPRWKPLLEGVCGSLGIEIQVARRVPALEEAIAHLQQFMAGRGR